MSEQTYTLTEEQLRTMLRDAVNQYANRVEQWDHEEIASAVDDTLAGLITPFDREKALAELRAGLTEAQIKALDELLKD